MNKLFFFINVFWENGENVEHLFCYLSLKLTQLYLQTIFQDYFMCICRWMYWYSWRRTRTSLRGIRGVFRIWKWGGGTFFIFALVFGHLPQPTIYCAPPRIYFVPSLTENFNTNTYRLSFGINISIIWSNFLADINIYLINNKTNFFLKKYSLIKKIYRVEVHHWEVRTIILLNMYGLNVNFKKVL